MNNIFGAYMVASPFDTPTAYLAALQTAHNRLPCVDLPVHRLTLELTKYCEVGCSFCKYNAPMPRKEKKDPKLYLSHEAIGACINFVTEAGIREVVLTGGGEPTHELESILRIIREAPASLFSLYTAGQWATDDDATVHMLSELHDAVASASSPSARLRIRVSVDTFHKARMGIEAPIAILTAFNRLRKALPRLDVYLRTVIHYDSPIQELARVMEGRIVRTDRHTGRLLLSDDIGIDILFMNLIPAGRLRPKGNVPLQVEPLRATLSGLRTTFGPGWPLVYDGGLNLGVRPSGRAYLYGSTPEDHGRVPDSPLAGILERIASDPVSVILMREGLLEFFEVISHCDPKIASTLEIHNDPPLLVPTACDTPQRLLLAKLAALILLSDDLPIAKHILADIELPHLSDGAREQRIGLLKQAYQEVNYG